MGQVFLCLKSPNPPLTNSSSMLGLISLHQQQKIMSSIEVEKNFTIETIIENEELQAILETHPLGIVIRPTRYREHNAIYSEATPFVKWLKKNSPETAVQKSETLSKISLHSNEIWMPFVFLANDVTLSVFLNLVSSYIYEKARGNLKEEKTIVHITAEYNDTKEGKFKKFTFSGDKDALQKAIKKVDLDKFYE